MSSGGYGGGGGYGGPPGGWGGEPPPGGGYGAPPGGAGAPPPGGGYGAPPGGPGAYTPPGWSAPGGFAPMPQGLPPGYTPEGSAGSLAGGVVPWEQKEGGIFGRWWATVKAVNGDTRPFFATAAQNDKADAVTFSMMTGAMAGIFVGLLYILIFSVLGAAFLMGLPAMGGGHKSGAPAAGALAAVSVGIGIVYAIMIAGMSAVMGAVRPFISGGIHHVLLAMFGGLNNPGKGFMHSVRVAAYAEGATMPWFWIPIAGPFIGLFYIFKNLVQGYDETHRSGTGKAVLALVAPLVCCCACYLLVFLLVGIPAAMKP